MTRINSLKMLTYFTQEMHLLYLFILNCSIRGCLLQYNGTFLQLQYNKLNLEDE
jgi:hypothetical protein